ncbi:uncharacterized protein PAC_05257 [Phialocephala subalpina]|uniref:Uncharacterized protein n=1 Tax=Phialocephala subalpina TaxID=576137 RepID=A0A1L7WRH7_9HELO|nr:uncharacterized protein PAC_05257 [Phialocephala subalpina]
MYRRPKWKSKTTSSRSKKLSQVRRCIDEWGLVPYEIPIPPPIPDSPTILPSTSVDEDWEFVSSHPSLQTSPTPSHISYTPSDPDILSHYAKKPLPSIPTSTPIPTNHLITKSKKRKAPHTDKLKVTCHHGPLASESHEVETTLSHVPNRPTPLETYADDEQSHEILALGLAIDSNRVPSFRKAGQPASSGRGGMRPRTRHRITIRFRKNKAGVVEKDGPSRGRDSMSPEE